MDRSQGRVDEYKDPHAGVWARGRLPADAIDPAHRLSPQRQFMEQNPEAQVPNKKEPVRSATTTTSATLILASAAVIIAKKLGLDITVDEAVILVGAIGAIVNILTNEVARQQVFAPYKR